MGAGKTTVGRALARQVGKEFYDSDQEIELRTGVRVSLIFEIEGEPGFRRREAETLERLTSLDNIVLATGGGAVLEASNRKLLASRGCVIYLHAKPAELAKRLGRDKTRPLLQGAEPRLRLEELYLQRDALYRETADIIMDTGRQSAQVLMEQLVERLDRECRLSA
jgi:shikimate kinase